MKYCSEQPKRTAIDYALHDEEKAGALVLMILLSPFLLVCVLLLRGLGMLRGKNK
jgi:hypothetical protein